MANNHKLAHGEKMLSLFTSEKSRDRANARRAIEGLNQQQQMVELLLETNAQLTAMSKVMVDLAQMVWELNAHITGSSPRLPQQPPPPRR